MRTLPLLFLISFACLPPTMAAGQMDHHDAMEMQDAPGEKLGTVEFRTSCSTGMRALFNRSVALMHSFQFGPAIDGFHAVLAGDPSCSMAYWGIALSSWGNPFAAGLKSPAQLEHGRKAVEEALAALPKTERERAYIEAVAHLYTESATLDQQVRKQGYANAMSAVHARYPQDSEAAIFYALSLAASADPEDKTYAKQYEAGAILDALFVKYPDHPGLAHYIIHTYDVPPLAPRAVTAARRYGAIAPSTPHALHMPSHTFTRVGDWQSSIDANLASAASARAAKQPADELHASDYLVYAYLQTAQDNAAKELAASADAMLGRLDEAVLVAGAGGASAAYFARAAMPARYCLERGAWADAAQLEVRRSALPYTDAITYFARGLGAARTGDAAGARAAMAALDTSRDRLSEMKERYWANQVDIQRREVSAWLALVEGNPSAALEQMRDAARREDATEKSAVTPGPLAPAREQLAEMLLSLHRPAEARKEFEATLVTEPNRFRSLYGAAEAAKQSGDGQAANVYFAKLLSVAEHADQPGRSELAEARRSVQRKAPAAMLDARP